MWYHFNIKTFISTQSGINFSANLHIDNEIVRALLKVFSSMLLRFSLRLRLCGDQSKWSCLMWLELLHNLNPVILPLSFSNMHIISVKPDHSICHFWDGYLVFACETWLLTALWPSQVLKETSSTSLFTAQNHNCYCWLNFDFFSS